MSDAPPRGLGFSFPLGVPFIVHPLLLVGIVAGRGRWWGYALHGVYLGVVGAFVWFAASRKRWELIHARVPTLTRANWVLNWGIFFIALPLLGWVFFGLRPLVR